MKTYCYWCAEHKECQHFEIVKGGRLQLVPFCQKCARYVGKDWNAPTTTLKESSVPQHKEYNL